MYIKKGNITVKLGAVIQILALTLLAACTSAGASASVCHASGDTANPYEEIAIDSTELLNQHSEHPNDIFPVPVGGCPVSLVVINNGEITICHATGNETDPYDDVIVSVDGLNGHAQHEGDVFPLSAEEGCPANPAVTSGKITICHATSSKKNPYNQITISVNGLSGHNKHQGDIIPAPAGGCPTSKP